MSAELIMTIKTETEKPVLTYSRTRGLVALITGMDWIFTADSSRTSFLFQNLNFFSLSFFHVAAFMKQRRMGLNDFIQKLATNSYACKQ